MWLFISLYTCIIVWIDKISEDACRVNGVWKYWWLDGKCLSCSSVVMPSTIFQKHTIDLETRIKFPAFLEYDSCPTTKFCSDLLSSMNIAYLCREWVDSGPRAPSVHLSGPILPPRAHGRRVVHSRACPEVKIMSWWCWAVAWWNDDAVRVAAAWSWRWGIQSCAEH